MLILSLKKLPHGEQHDYAHKLLAVCLKNKGIEYNSSVKIIKGTLGKPSLAEHPDIHYNLSHADGITGCYIGKNECGIDVEGVRAYRPKVMKRAFSETETALVENAPEAERDMIFFRLWTLKESYAKAIGIGVSYPLNTVEFSFRDNEIITNVKGYSFRQYIIDNSYVAAICEKD
jgi:4'-phosphopantetheinyl transferase